jgi:hypothetical protein
MTLDFADSASLMRDSLTEDEEVRAKLTQSLGVPAQGRSSHAVK